MSSTSVRTGKAAREPTHPFDPTFYTYESLRASSLEIVLLALGVLLLVTLLVLVLFIGHRSRTNQPNTTSSQFHNHYTRGCLWSEVFPPSTREERLSVMVDNGTERFLDEVRKRSRSYARALTHELKEVGRTLGGDGIGPERDLEGGIGYDDQSDTGDMDRRWSSGADVETAERARRRVSSFVRDRGGRSENALSDGW